MTGIKSNEVVSFSHSLGAKNRNITFGRPNRHGAIGMNYG